MQYICPDLICPHCGAHTFYDTGKIQFWTSEQTCQNCGKIFLATSKLKNTPVKSYESASDKLDLEKDVFINYYCYKPSKSENSEKMEMKKKKIKMNWEQYAKKDD